MKLGIVMEGGASRTAFSCGVTDCFWRKICCRIILWEYLPELHSVFLILRGRKEETKKSLSSICLINGIWD